jgi:cell wall assembly regulator SMI1
MKKSILSTYGHPFHPLTEKRAGDHVFIYLNPGRSTNPFTGVISRIEGNDAIVTWEKVRDDVPRRFPLFALIKL